MNWLDPVRTRLAGLGARAMIALAALVACALAPGVANAQTRSVETATARGRAVVLTPLSFINTRAMDFGRIATTAAGTVTLSPVTNACTPSAGVLRIGTCQPAEFAGRGALNLVVRIRVNESTINLTGPGAPMRLDTFTVGPAPNLLYIGAPGNPRYRILTPTGIFTFRVGGTLRINANQLPGQYRGTFTVRADYL